MTRTKVEKIRKGIEDKIRCNTVDMEEWAEYWGFTEDEYDEFLDVAIEALEQEPSEDTISRQAVEEMIKAEMPERGMWEIEGDKEKETVCEVCVDLMQKLSELPPIESKPSEDCISREYLKSFGYINKGNFNSVETIREWIDNAPSVIPKAKEGEWIAKDGIFYCSCCDNDSAELSEEDVYLYKLPLPNYCPYCGARMKSIKLDCELLKEVCHILKELKESDEE